MRLANELEDREPNLSLLDEPLVLSYSWDEQDVFLLVFLDGPGLSRLVTDLEKLRLGLFVSFASPSLLDTCDDNGSI